MYILYALSGVHTQLDGKHMSVQFIHIQQLHRQRRKRLMVVAWLCGTHMIHICNNQKTTWLRSGSILLTNEQFSANCLTYLFMQVWGRIHVHIICALSEYIHMHLDGKHMPVQVIHIQQLHNRQRGSKSIQELQKSRRSIQGQTIWGLWRKFFYSD